MIAKLFGLKQSYFLNRFADACACWCVVAAHGPAHAGSGAWIEGHSG